MLDVQTVLAGLAGRNPPPFSARQPLARHLMAPADASARELLASRKLVAADVTRETPDAVSIHLIDPTGRKIAFVPGQFLTLLVTLPSGETLRRAYSISTLPDEDGSSAQVTITIKRVADGVVSNHLNDTARQGDSFDVLGPSGNFTTTYDATRSRHLVLIAGGSGITPLASIARAVIAREPSSRVTLVYGNRSVDDIIYREAIEQLASTSNHRFVVRHVLQDSPPGFAGRTGLLDRANMDAELESLDPADEYFVCGPEPMMQAVREALDARGVAATSIHEERFSSPARRVRLDVPFVAQRLVVRKGGAERDLMAKAGQTLLEAGLEASIRMPYSCSMGGCGACRIKLVSGDVVAEEPNCLSDEEREEGFVLACVSRPSSTCVVEVA